MQLTIGSCIERLQTIPLSIIEESASVSSRNGHTNTTSIRGAGAEEDLERSATRRWRAVAAIARSIKARAGIHNQIVTSSDSAPLKVPERTAHDKYVIGIGRRIDAPVIERAGRAIGPATAFHQRPQSDSESRCTRAGEETAAMNAGARIKEA